MIVKTFVIMVLAKTTIGPCKKGTQAVLLESSPGDLWLTNVVAIVVDVEIFVMVVLGT